ncbi:MAG: 8-oxoguanine DNA glycosylase [Bacilli bacterium]|nr:8-oxoguanine DNA glycosylase [Bacilli bacterium]
MITIKDTNINLEDTITCGQIFRYEKEKDNSYTIVLSDRVVNLKKDNNDLLVTSNLEDNLENVVKKYLDLDRDYNKLNDKLIDIDSSLKNIIDECYGLKIINQPRFECIISYIVSQNNRVSQIANSLNNISKKYGKEVSFNNKKYYLFPNLEDLKNVSIEEFRNLKVGFRDKYIYEFIKNMTEKNIDIDIIDSMSSEDALKYLMQNKGIGEKVASCILLFSYSRFDVFPIDTWVKKYMSDKYNITDVKNIRKFSKEKYKDYCGLMIQYMFHYKRNKEI